MSNFTSKITDTQQDGKKWTRIFWAVVVGVLTISMLYVGGIPTLQSATIVMGLPFAFVIYLVMYGLFKSLRLELLQQDSTRRALHGAMSGRAVDGQQGDWRNRLARSMSFPGKKPVMRYLDRVVQPALEQVADAIRERGGEVTLHREPAEEVGIDQIDLQVGFGEEMSLSLIHI